LPVVAKKCDEENEKQKELAQEAFQNFVVLYLEVDEVDFVDLGPSQRAPSDWVKTIACTRDRGLEREPDD
jgi:hypothetical protein